MKWRAENVVPQRIEAARQFIQSHDFSNLAEITMRESNELHSNCTAAYPPINYLTDTSRSIIDSVHALNEQGIIAAYSFDAGPNPCIFCLEENLDCVLQSIDPNNQFKKIVSKPSTGIQCVYSIQE